MLQYASQWLDTTNLTNPVERRQARLFQGMILVLIGACIVGPIVSLLTGNISPVSIVSYTVILLTSIASLAMVRRGLFSPAVLLITCVIVLMIGAAVLGSGQFASSGSLLAFSVPITMAGLLLGRRGLVPVAGLSVAVVVIAGALQEFAPGNLTSSPATTSSTWSPVISFVLLVSVLSLIIDRFGTSLREALVSSQEYAHELEQMRSSLETTVAERTASLQTALAEVAQRESHLTEALAALQSSNETVRSLSAPIIPVLPGVLVAPLIGDVNAERAEMLMSGVLTAVERESVHHVIFDITGVPVVDTQVAQVLLRTATAVRLLGARTLLVGVRPEVAQTLVSLGIDLQSVKTFADLRAAVGTLLA
jgi:anti-anti-sigma factor